MTKTKIWTLWETSIAIFACIMGLITGGWFILFYDPLFRFAGVVILILYGGFTVWVCSKLRFREGRDEMTKYMTGGDSMEKKKVKKMKEKICRNCKHQEVCTVKERAEPMTYIGRGRYAFPLDDIAKICQYYEEEAK